MYCKYCGKEFSDGMFCPYCGKKNAVNNGTKVNNSSDKKTNALLVAVIVVWVIILSILIYPSLTDNRVVREGETTDESQKSLGGKSVEEKERRERIRNQNTVMDVTTYYYDAAGEIKDWDVTHYNDMGDEEKNIHYEVYDTTGKVESWKEYKYASGTLVELITYAPDGKAVNRWRYGLQNHDGIKVDIEYDIQDGDEKEKTWIEYECDAIGRDTKKTTYHVSKNVYTGEPTLVEDYEEYYEYDVNDHLVKREKYNNEWNYWFNYYELIFVSKEEWEYKNSGDSIEKYRYYSEENSDPARWEIYSYDDYGNLIKVRSTGGCWNEWQYDDNGSLLLKYTEYSSSGNPEETVIYEYNEYDEVIKESHINAGGAPLSTIEFEYDDSGLKICAIHYGTGGKLLSKEEFTYQDKNSSYK